MIDGVMTKKLKVIPDERGRLMECLRSDDDLFVKFGQFYMTTTLPGVVKGWHLHDEQWDNIVCVKGMIKLVLFDGRGADGPPRPSVSSTSSSSACTTRCWCACRPACGTAGSA
jgi:dTDP-4-dehydrorhamnose 3,5-epimerase-like enzyme